jgi:OPA family glycerol-3-phosphate transporter-like MFS transporter
MKISHDSVEVTKKYLYWRFRLMYALILGYAAFYIIRQNFPIAAPRMDIDLKQIGWAFAAFNLIYGTFKFISGTICDRMSARYFMPIGLFGAAIVNLVIGFSDSVWLMGAMIVLNACFQSMGWPSVTRSLTQWFGPKELGMRWGIVNASHQIGSVAILMGGAWLVQQYNWRYAFIVPSVICIVIAFIIFERLRDTPESLGLPSVEEFEGLATVQHAQQPHKQHPHAKEVHHHEPSFKKVFVDNILFNARLWTVCSANFFVYFVRMGFFCWAPIIILKTKGVSLISAGFKTSVLELSGLPGGIFAGWFTDRYLSDRRGLCGFFMMMALAVTITIYWLFPTQNPILDSVYWGLMGFFIYGPQTISGLSSAEFGSKRAAAAAAGLNGTIGYLGGAVVGVSIPWIASAWGWEEVYMAFIIAALLGGFFFLATTWKFLRKKT